MARSTQHCKFLLSENASFPFHICSCGKTVLELYEFRINVRSLGTQPHSPKVNWKNRQPRPSRLVFGV